MAVTIAPAKELLRMNGPEFPFAQTPTGGQTAQRTPQPARPAPAPPGQTKQPQSAPAAQPAPQPAAAPAPAPVSASAPAAAFDFSALRARPFDHAVVQAALDAGVDPATVVRELAQARAGTQASLGERGDALAAAREVLSFLRGAGGNYVSGEASQSDVLRLLLNAGMEDLVRQELMRNPQIQGKAPELQKAYQDYHIARLRGEDLPSYSDYIAQLRAAGALPPATATDAPVAGGAARPTVPVPLTTLPATTLPATVPAQPPAETVPAMTLPAQLSQFGPGQDLISTQIAPTGFAPSAAAERARALTLQSLESLFSTPDRATLASQQFRDLLEQAAEARRTGVRDISRAAAALGRIGAGITTSQLGDLEERIQTQIAREASRLAAETAAQELADRLARFEAALAAGGQLRGEDLAEARFGQSLRDELRGERAYQYGLSRDAIADRIRQIQLEEQLLQGEHSREMDRLNALLAIALGGPDPMYALERAAAGAQGQASQFWDLVGEILRLYGQRREQQQRSTTI